ncbi:hypothetical protein [Fulvimonas yonginensis]|uniref:Uncharacterized protein n=1 Tax=Fulvimonas yonginensis TaxID=1495200 RepID=A0ABU8JB90_9GAMM
MEIGGDLLQLQVNTSGAWRNVLAFEADRRDQVLAGLSALAGVLGDSAQWCLLHPNGRREWLHDIGARVRAWAPVTGEEPAPLQDVEISVFAPGDEEPTTFMAYRKQAGSELFYLSGTPDQVVRGAYAWRETDQAAPLSLRRKAA